MKHKIQLHNLYEVTLSDEIKVNLFCNKTDLQMDWNSRNTETSVVSTLKRHKKKSFCTMGNYFLL